MLEAMVFFEHSGADPVMLPANQMWARVDFDTRHLAVDLPPIDMSISHDGETTPEPFGVQETRDGVVVSGAGSLDVRGSARIEAENLPLLKQVTSLQVRLSFGVRNGPPGRAARHAEPYGATQYDEDKLGL